MYGVSESEPSDYIRPDYKKIYCFSSQIEQFTTYINSKLKTDYSQYYCF